MNKMMNFLKWVFRFFVIIIAFLFVLGELVFPKEIKDKEYCEQFDVSWKMIRSDGSVINDIHIPGDYVAERNEIVTVETVLPEDIQENLYLCFRSNRQDIEIYVDGKLRQSYSTLQSKPYGHSSAGAFVFMKIKRGDGGKTLRVNYQTDTGYSGKLRVIYYGDKMGIWKTLLKDRGDELCISVLMLILGVFSVVGSLILRFCYKKPLALEYLGWGVTLAACWMISDSIFRQLFFSNVSVVNDFAFVMVMLLPFPFLIYMNEIQKRRYNVFYVVACSLVALDSIVCIALQFLNIIDFADSITVFASFCGISILLIFITMIADCFRGNIGQYKLTAIGIFGAAVAGVLQMTVYFARIAAYSGFMIAVGMIFLLVISIINTIQDILMIEKEKQQAIFANESKARFLANMSHEIRTPINAVLGMNEMILRESSDSQILEYASDIKQSGNLLLSLINDILDFSKIESGKMDIIPVDYDLGILLNDTIEMIRSRAEEKKLQLEVKIEPDTPVHLHGDEVRIRQIITNILTNAVKYTPKGKVILTVSGKKMSPETVQLYVSVKDTGIGIKEEDKERLFDSFQRVDESRNRNIEGTGLGLSITMQLLNLMGSRLEVESTYGEGSEFYFYLEQKQLDDEVIGEDIQEYYENEKGKIQISTEQFYAPAAKILVVDDNEMNLKVFLGLLKNHGMQIDTALSGKECLKRIELNAYHIIFMDHMMPEMDGVETLRRIREQKTNQSKDAVIIALTANAISGAKEMFLNEGFYDYLSKPVNVKDLEKMIQKYLPGELLLKNDMKQKEEVSNESSDYVKSTQLENSLVDWEKGKQLCMEDEEFYREILEIFLDSPTAMELKQYYEESDFENYRIKIHAMKSNLSNIGATTVSDMAKKLEYALKYNNDVSYVQENHEEFMLAYERVVCEVRTYMNA